MDPIDLAALPPSSRPATSSATPDLGPQAFLKLLTTQLQNQDPLDPMANEDFIAQLAQFASVERLMGIEDGVGALYGGIASMNNASMSSLLGRGVVARGDSVQLPEEGGVDLRFDASADVSSGTAVVRDESGRIVANVDFGARSQGEHAVHWDGRGDDGGTLPPGTYTFSIDASDASGDPVHVDTLITGTVTEVDYSDGVPLPSVDGVPVSLDAILRLTEAI